MECDFEIKELIVKKQATKSQKRRKKKKGGGSDKMDFRLDSEDRFLYALKDKKSFITLESNGVIRLIDQGYEIFHGSKKKCK